MSVFEYHLRDGRVVRSISDSTYYAILEIQRLSRAFAGRDLDTGYQISDQRRRGVMADKKKRLVRELQNLRGIQYQSALNELNELGPDVSWSAYIDLVREQLSSRSGTSREPK